jgi:hypothetical protein
MEAGNFGRLRSQGGCAFFDPSLQHRHLRGGEFLFSLRHLAGFHHLEQDTFLRAPRDQDAPGLAVGEHQASQPEVHPALQLLALPVTLEAMGLEDRPDVPLKGERTRMGIRAQGTGLAIPPARQHQPNGEGQSHRPG